jgi:pimeloyl-ACP methyl ester carboxylesterase
MRFVFLHGGPGFNSVAEQAILGPLFHAAGHEIVFWNEPSRLRSDGDPFQAADAYTRWLESAERCVLRSAAPEPVHLIAHSFAPHAAVEIARRHAHRLASLTLVAPSANLLATYRNVLELASEDLREVKPDVAAAIEACHARTRMILDEAMREGILLALQDERLFTHYFVNAEQLQAVAAAQARPEAQFDVESMLAVLADFGTHGPSIAPTPPVTTPCLILFAVQDVVSPSDEHQAMVLAAIPGAHIVTMDGCSHYPHLDRPQPFVDVVVGWAQAKHPRGQ